MKIKIYIGILICLANTASGQFSLPTLVDRHTENGIHIGLFNTSGEWYHSPAPLNQSIYEEAGSLVFDINPIIQDLDTDNRGFIDSKIKTIDLSYVTDRFRFSIFHEVHHLSNIQYPFDLAFLATRGNTTFIGETIEVGPSLEYQHYHAIGVGGSINLGKIWIGGNIKTLAGTEYLNSRENQISLSTGEDNFELALDREYVLESSSLLEYNGIEDVDIDWDPTVFNTFFGNNAGFSVDMMASYQVNSQWDVYGAVENIGRINWDNRTTRYTAAGIIEYTGIDILDFLSEDNTVSIKDSLYSLLDFSEEESVEFSSNTPRYYSMGIQFLLDDKTLFTAQYRLSQYNTFSIPRMNAAYERSITNFFDMGISYTYMPKAADNLGLYANFHIGTFQMHTGIKNILGIVDLLNTQYNQVYFGVNFHI